MTLREVRLPGGERVAVDKPLADNKPVKVEHTFKLPAETEISAAVLAGRAAGEGTLDGARSGAHRPAGAAAASPPSSSSPSVGRR